MDQRQYGAWNGGITEDLPDAIPDIFGRNSGVSRPAVALLTMAKGASTRRDGAIKSRVLRP
ncbi:MULTISPECIES: hypothetical protein [Methylobacterium]|uniref:hypothetical protein n=1 Tax=Methylobacterium TaxID=407 RepID=UPI0011CBFD00|nr:MULTISPECIES: hypothetical protein [Methylobacterium]TXN23951.1 hypothetical protein FV217_04595 [Methylobacterium sp. WL9]